MSKLRSLLSLELRSLYGINRFRYTRDPKEKNRYRLLLLGAWVIVIAMVFSYVGGLVYGLCRRFWVVESLPIPTKALLDSKILLALTVLLYRKNNRAVLEQL